MAAQTEYIVPAVAATVASGSGGAVTPGTTTRQWMTGSGGYLNEVIAAVTVAARPVVQVSG